MKYLSIECYTQNLLQNNRKWRTGQPEVKNEIGHELIVEAG